MQRCIAELRFIVYVRPGLNEHRNDILADADCGEVERRSSFRSPRGERRSRIDQQLGDASTVVGSGSMKRNPPVLVGQIWVASNSFQVVLKNRSDELVWQNRSALPTGLSRL
jgi:hypothetical protein